MRKYALALVAFAFLTGLPCLGAEAQVAAQPEIPAVAAAPASSPAADVPAPDADEVRYWILAETPAMPQWLKLTNCGEYCLLCGGCCAILGPNSCACC